MPISPPNGASAPGWRLNTRNPWARRSYWRHAGLGLILLALPTVLEYNPQPPGEAKQDQAAVKQAPVHAKPRVDTKPKPKLAHVEPPKSPVPAKKPDTSSKGVATKAGPKVVTEKGDAISDWCRAVAGRLFSVSPQDCQGRGYTDTGYRSVQGRVIPVRDVNAQKSPSLGRVLLVGGTHGDELTSVSIVFWWLQMLDEHPSAISWRVAPVMNPDGVLARPPSRLNANNVDLNRNLPTPGWAKASRAYWQEVGRAPRRYPGANPGSEPETKWLVHEVKTYKPDVIVSIHAPYGVLDYDGNFPPPQRLGDLSLHRLGVFPGSLGNYGSRYLGIPVITVELTNASNMPSRKRARAMWNDLNQWLQKYLTHERDVKREKDSVSS